MIRRIALFPPAFASLCAMTLAPLAASAQKFEGIVSTRVSGGGGAMDMTYSVKGDLVRMDMSGPGGMSIYMLHDAATNSGKIVLPAQQMYMEQPAMSIDAVPGRGRARGGQTQERSVRWTGQKEIIAGYECEHLLIADDNGGQVDVCAAKGLGTFTMHGSPLGMGGGAQGRGDQAGPAWARGLPADVFPLKVQSGTDIPFEVTKIEKKSLDASLFTVPDGFQKMDMGMMRGRPPRV